MADLQSFAELFRRVYRDFNLDGVPASGANEPEKAAIRAIGAALDLALAAASVGDLEQAMALLQPMVDDATAARDEAEAAAKQYRDETSLYRDAFTGGLAWPWVFGGYLVGGLRRDGNMELPGLVLRPGASGASGASRDGSTGFTPLISPLGLDGAFLLGCDGEGRLDFRPSPELVDRFAALLPQDAVNAAVLRGSWGSAAFNVRGRVGHYLATVRDRSGRSFDAKQLKVGSQTNLVIASPRPMKIILVMGQSNAGEGGNSGVALSRALYPFSLFGLAGLTNSAAYGSSALSAALVTDLNAAADVAGAAGVRGQFPAKMAGFALSHLNAELGRDEPGYVCVTAWEGSQPISSFVPGAPGHFNHENALALIAAAKTQAAKYGRTVEIDTLVWIQGEAGPSGRSVYGGQLDALLTQILPLYKAATGQVSNIKAVLAQTNVLQGASENYACMGQYDVAQARADTVLAGPMYCYPLYDTAHLTALGRMMQGGVLAEAIAAATDAGDWKPVQIASVARSGVYLDVTYEGTMFERGFGLSIDRDWTPAVPFLGFSAWGGGIAALTDAKITGPRSVRLTFASPVPASGVTLQYATAVNSAAAGWAFRLGNLMVESDRPDLFQKIGFAVPQRVRHYAIRQEISIT